MRSRCIRNERWLESLQHKGFQPSYFYQDFIKKPMETWAYFYENEKKGCFIKISRKNHRKKIVKNKIGVTEKGLFGIS